MSGRGLVDSSRAPSDVLLFHLVLVDGLLTL